VVVVLSKEFISKKYPMEELRLLLHWREAATAQGSGSAKLLLLYHMTYEELGAQAEVYRRAAAGEMAAELHREQWAGNMEKLGQWAEDLEKLGQWAEDLEKLGGITGFRKDQVGRSPLHHFPPKCFRLGMLLFGAVHCLRLLLCRGTCSSLLVAGRLRHAGAHAIHSWAHQMEAVGYPQKTTVRQIARQLNKMLVSLVSTDITSCPDLPKWQATAQSGRMVDCWLLLAAGADVMVFIAAGAGEHVHCNEGQGGGGHSEAAV
jgi:hypothetical protein